jgi:hypothetical protein
MHYKYLFRYSLQFSYTSAQVSLAALSDTEVNIFRLEVARRMRLPPWVDYLPDDLKVSSSALNK